MIIVKHDHGLTLLCLPHNSCRYADDIFNDGSLSKQFYIIQLSLKFAPILYFIQLSLKFGPKAQ